ncbi:S8 family peptidase [Pontivivens ytuae]|uniref:S8 family peptidase n=1 Tax=Pontivivens ytuae TaxID=2789856 RepID=A0A7S9LQB1_9RHOB|nr:S8 family peptidase [Pontivivens ytuae]QPH53341.1 S8 family peptidase [Pontivivens ytuae]
MDPALQQLTRGGDRAEILEAVARLAPGRTRLPRGAREVTRFGQIRTLRLARHDIRRVWADPTVASLKAPRLLQLERPPNPALGEGLGLQVSRRPLGLRETGRGVVVGIIDWGFDVAHPAFLDAEGRSRITALWDQRRPPRGTSRPAPYGYGQVFTKRQIDRSLAERHPYDALGYHPGDADTGIGTHGSHVADIAAGSARPDAQSGVAPEAELVFVHLASSPLSGLANLGDSVRILEAVDFIARTAADKPLVINMSIGRHGGPHTGLTLVERALDAFVAGRRNTQIVQSGGNYFRAGAHSAGRLAPGRRRTLDWIVSRGDRTGNELELWYSNRDRLDIAIASPDGTPIPVALGEAVTFHEPSGEEVGRAYHRAFDPNTPDHHFDVFLYTNAPSGRWRVQVEGTEVADGRFHAWIERDRGGRRGQSRFSARDIETSCTIGSICNGFLTIAVGAADQRSPFTAPASFASAGPTRDGRTKPDVLAPGVRIEAARSTPPGEERPVPGLTRMSGASQAAPFVAGVCALCLQAGQGRLDAAQLRRALIGTATPLRPLAQADIPRLGAGMIDVEAAVDTARALARHPQHL